EWVVDRLRDQKEERSIGILSAWTHKKNERSNPGNDQRNQPNRLPKVEAIQAIIEIASPKKYIRGTQGNQMNVKCKLTTLDTLQSETVEALLDSGCTGSCIDSQFVKDKRYETRKIPRPIPVYNADGTLNKNGAINEFVILLMEINGHVEKIHLAVTNLG
ncbi:hypothetical protein SERLA73DRAFT_42203, partial [Serpula lacrymans var. lacrymans S7.3]